VRSSLPLVLMVEDNPAHKDLIIRYMKYVEKKIDHAEDGQAALDYLFRRGKYAEKRETDLPDLIMLDLRLPKIDGLEVLHAIKTSNTLKAIPVIILSSSERPSDIRAAYANGANSYLVKAVGSSEFSDQIKILENYWLVENRMEARFNSNRS